MGGGYNLEATDSSMQLELSAMIPILRDSESENA